MNGIGLKPRPRTPNLWGLAAIAGTTGAATLAGLREMLLVIGECCFILCIPLVILVYRRAYGWLMLFGAAAVLAGLLAGAASWYDLPFIVLWGVPHVLVAYLVWLNSPCNRQPYLPSDPCPHCGYNLTGNTSGICPECGIVTPVRARERYQREMEAAADELLQATAAEASPADGRHMEGEDQGCLCDTD